MRKPLVYIASPYTKGDPAINTHFQCKTFDDLMNAKIVTPYIPLLSHFQHLLFPRVYTDWIEYDNEIIPRMDACLRLTATNAACNYCVSESSGADNEVRLFQEMRKPVFYGIPEMHYWAKHQWIDGGVANGT